MRPVAARTGLFSEPTSTKGGIWRSRWATSSAAGDCRAPSTATFSASRAARLTTATAASQRMTIAKHLGDEFAYGKAFVIQRRSLEENCRVCNVAIGHELLSELIKES